MLFVVVVYDIGKSKARRRVSILLEAHGRRVNRSVFECLFKNEAQKESFCKRLKKEINPKKDSIRCYNLCQKCIQKSQELGKHSDPFESDPIYFV